MPSDESVLWERILKIPSVGKEMLEHGFFLSNESFRSIASSFGLQMKLQAPQYLSKDFWSRQPRFLIEQGYYVLRTGIGKFALLDENIFPRPYLTIQTQHSKDLTPEIPNSYKHLITAFKENAQENAALEQMRFFKVFEKMMVDLFGTDENVVGPRGSKRSSFDIFIEKNNHEKKKLCTYRGQEELDYSLWTEENALLFEAKQTNRSDGFLDLGWHKLVYPANRFRQYETSLYPAYFLRRPTETFIFVFPRVQFYESGIIINDANAMKPKETYRVRI